MDYYHLFFIFYSMIVECVKFCIIIIIIIIIIIVASWLARWTPNRAVCVRALAGDIVLCSWARHLTLTLPPLSTQVYRWVPAK